MDSRNLEEGDRVIDIEDGSKLVVTDTDIGSASETSYNGKPVSDSNTDYPESDPVVEVVYEGNVINNHQVLGPDFSIMDLTDYENKYGVHIKRYYFPISRLEIKR